MGGRTLWRGGIVLLAAATIVGCQSSPTGSGVGSLALTVTGLPPGMAAAITVTGPGSYSQNVGATTTLANLTPGTYAVAANIVTASGQNYTASPSSQNVPVTAGQQATATVTYSLAAPASLALQLVVSGLSSPVYLTAPPGDPRLFIVEQTGTIRIYKNGALNATPFLDVSSIISCCGEQGLLSVAFHPNYANNGTFYFYIVNKSGNLEIRRGTVSSNPDTANSSTDLVLMIPHPTNTNHNGGLLKFGLDGFLYAGTGDGGGGGDPPNNAQTKTVLLGKLLRIDVDHPNGATLYSIPSGNPFGNEVWAYGLRNPWRWSFDPPSGLLYIGDVGQNLYEEVDIEPATAAGLNYGWHIMEGLHCYDPSSGCNETGLTLPQLEYPHSDPTSPCAIIGGYVYRGSAIPAIVGTYFYSDLCAGWLRSFEYTTAGGVTNKKTWDGVAISSPTSFGEDSQGELYLVSDNGQVFKIVNQ